MTSPERLLTELGRLAETLGPAVRPVGTDALLRSLTGTARELFGAAACSLALLTDDETELVYTTAAGAGADDVTGMRIPANKGIAGWVVNSGQPIAVNDLGNDPRFARDVAEQSGYVPNAILAVPVVSPVRLLGVISLLDRDANRPGASEDMRLLTLFADQAAIALESVRAFAELGRVLLAAVADTAEQGSELQVVIERTAADLPSADRDIAELASMFATLSTRGAAEHRLALGVLRQFADYVQRRSSRTL